MQEQNLRPSGRLLLFRVVVVCAFLVLVGQLWHLQIASGTGFRRQADRNRFRLVSVSAPRGVIYDRYGRILARNRPTFTVAVVPADLPEDEEEANRVLRRLSYLLETSPTVEPEGGDRVKVQSESSRTGQLGRATPTPGQTPSPTPTPTVDREEVKQKIALAQLGSAFRPIPVVTGISRELAFVIEERSYMLPGIHVLVEPVRDYPTGATTAHIIGYMGPIPAELSARYRERGYAPNDKVGLA
ncbi:MAG TPA: hypothetical protein EYP04_04270, partial [Anaerolineae bacterium]|nr:hypothetical protein [Anaerolineae bacterium]